MQRVAITLVAISVACLFNIPGLCLSASSSASATQLSFPTFAFQTSVTPISPRPDASPQSSDLVLQNAFDSRQSDIQVEGHGQVIRLLPDDREGSQHQRFIVRLQSGLTLLIAHNIDLAPRVASLREGDEIAFFGEYEWNPQGGVIHWTHRDPSRQHVDGWIDHRGRRYQ